MRKKRFCAPCINVVTLRIERGFASSGANDYAEPGEAGMLQEGATYEF